MPINVTMPALSPTMSEGKLARWHKAVGDKVAAGDVLAEIETDKATMELEAVDAGTMGRIVVPEGSEGVPVNTVIAQILEDGEDAGALSAQPGAAKQPVAAPVPAAPPAAARVAAPALSPPQTGRVIASPLARRIAKDRGVDLAGVRGTGPHGRIVKADVVSAQAAPTPPAVVTAAPAVGGDAIPHSMMRKIIAQRLTEAWRTIPHIYLTVDCSIDALLELRERLNRNGTKLSVNDFVVRASAFALKQVPQVNAQWSDKAIVRLPSVDVSVAVALEDGLITPIIRNADGKGLAQISSEVRALAARGKDGKLLPEEYQGGSFTVSNLGMLGVREFGAIVNPPQAAILAVGAGEKRPVVKDGVLGIATVMTCTLSCDHRVIDGAVGAKFLGVLKGFLEDPVTMML